MAKIFVIGIGPGGEEHMTGSAIDAIRRSEVIIGYEPYIELIKRLVIGKIVRKGSMTKEVERCEQAASFAQAGKTTAIISSGDAGVYGMAGIMLEVVNVLGIDIEVEIVPGISAVNAAAASLGAPLMHDFAVISLSDLLTPLPLIANRLKCAAMGDFVTAIYNPKSIKRTEQIAMAREIFLQYRDENTPVGIVKNAKRHGENITITNLTDMLKFEIDMLTIVIIGNSNTYVQNGKMITPRGYKV